MGIKKSDTLSDKTKSGKVCIQIMIHVWLFFRCKCVNVLHNPPNSQHYDRPHYSFRCNIESKHLREYVALSDNDYVFSLINFIWALFEI